MSVANLPTRLADPRLQSSKAVWFPQVYLAMLIESLSGVKICSHIQLPGFKPGQTRHEYYYHECPQDQIP